MKAGMILLAVGLAMVLTPVAADAAVTQRFVSRGCRVAGYETWDLVISSSSDWTKARLDVVLTSGTFYTDHYGTDAQPNPALFVFVPALEWDTFVTLPESFPNTESMGDIPCMLIHDKVFDDTELHVTWFDSIVNPPVHDKVIARLTISCGAQGTLTGRIYDAETQGVGTPFAYALLPEPATLILAAVGGQLLVSRRRIPYRPERGSK